MSRTLLLRVAASLAVSIYGLVTYLTVRGNSDAMSLTIWGTSPHLAALFVVLCARDIRKLLVAVVAIALFWVTGLTVFHSGGARGLFLPLWELILLSVAFVVVSLSSRRAR
jgi:hypothetical protein